MRLTRAVAGALRCGLAVLVLVGSGGCVGYTTTRFDWVRVPSELKTRTDLRARLGEPVRTLEQDGRSVWYYDLPATELAGPPPATEGVTILYLLVAPLWWRTRPEGNARFALDGDTITDAAQLSTQDHGWFCGLNVAAERFFLCGSVP